MKVELFQSPLHTERIGECAGEEAVYSMSKQTFLLQLLLIELLARVMTRLLTAAE
jgi:hypothetical protein